MSTPTADDVRRAVLRDGIKGRDEEIARYRTRAARAEADAATLREYVQHKLDCPRSLPNIALDLGPGWTQSVAWAKPCNCGLAALTSGG